MTAASALLTVALLQQVAPPADTPTAVDVIELERGGQLEGRIVEETGDYVQIELASGAIVGFERTRISRITRGATPASIRSEPVERDAPHGLRPLDEWFVIHDAEGRVVGRLHRTVTFGPEGQLRLGEEWEFVERTGSTAVTRLEVVTPGLEPVSSFYHERRLRGDGRTLKERLVRGTVEGDDFVVEKQTLGERDRRVYALDPTLRLPMAVLESMRQEPYRRIAVSHVVFDASEEEFARRSFASGRPRTVQWHDVKQEVLEVSSQSHDGHNIEWLDAAGRTVRREVNGPALVAVPVPAEMTERYLMAKEPAFPAAVMVESRSRFALWLPNPSWRLLAPEPGQVTAQDAVDGATVSLLSFDQLGTELRIDSVADAVIRWLRMARDGVEIAGREHVRVRDRTAVRIDAVYADQQPGHRADHRCEIFVFSVDGRHMAICFAAPLGVFEELRGDFARMLDSVELHPGCLGSESSERDSGG